MTRVPQVLEGEQDRARDQEQDQAREREPGRERALDAERASRLDQSANDAGGVATILRARVTGMVSPHCVRAVFTALAAVEGIARAEVTMGALEIEHDGRVTIEQVREAVAVAGYGVEDAAVERRLPIVGEER